MVVQCASAMFSVCEELAYWPIWHVTQCMSCKNTVDCFIKLRRCTQGLRCAVQHLSKMRVEQRVEVSDVSATAEERVHDQAFTEITHSVQLCSTTHFSPYLLGLLVFPAASSAAVAAAVVDLQQQRCRCYCYRPLLQTTATAVVAAALLIVSCYYYP
eukprot:16248-Heterococcus_DN1.PRE.3